LKNTDEINQEITMVLDALNKQYDDKDAHNFYNGRLAALQWVLELEP